MRSVVDRNVVMRRMTPCVPANTAHHLQYTLFWFVTSALLIFYPTILKQTKTLQLLPLLPRPPATQTCILPWQCQLSRVARGWWLVRRRRGRIRRCVFTVSASGLADHDGCTAEQGITEATARCNKNNTGITWRMCQSEGIGWSSNGFYAVHWFVLGAPALGGERIYLVKYRGGGF